MRTIVKRRVCTCENCGNEAEMEITCSLPENASKASTDSPPASSAAPPSPRVKGQATCTHCGNEADMWVDL